MSGADGQTVQRTVEYPQLHFLDKIFIPVVVVSGADGPTVQRTVDYPQLHLLDKVFFPVVVVSGADGLTVQKTVEYPQLQFQDKVYMTIFWSGAGDQTVQSMTSAGFQPAVLNVAISLGDPDVFVRKDRLTGCSLPVVVPQVRLLDKSVRPVWWRLHRSGSWTR